MATEELLKEFPSVATAEWEQAINADLKGADYAKKLVWQTPEGLAVKPYYRAEDLAGVPALHAAPGSFPYLRGASAQGGWLITEEIAETDPEQANAAARAAIAAGTEQVAFTGVAIANLSDLGLALAGLDEIPVHFASATPALLSLLAERLAARQQTATLSAAWNPLEDAKFAAEFLQKLPAKLIPFTLDGATLEESGATAVEEVGLTLAAGVDYLAAMTTHGVAAEQAAKAVNFSFAMGANFFFQIAKLRAFRTVWAQAAAGFGAENAQARIAARTSRWNKAVYDAHNNILRGTTEALSAVLGGAHSISVASYDECFRTPNEASKRLARNTQLVLKQEAQLGRVSDPGGGSYYLETLTDFLGRKGWELIQKIESVGGYQKASADGIVAAMLAHSMGTRNKFIAQRRDVLTGVNQFVNAQEKVLDAIDASRMDGIRRAAQPFERLRLRTERHAQATGNTPKVLLAEMGDVKMRGLRSQFAGDFLACAGFTLVKQRFDKAEALVAEQADLIVLCSSDPEYPALAAAVLTALRAAGRTTPVLVAGNPDTAEELKAAGVADFVHIRTNPIEFLTRWQQQLGIEA